MLTRWVGSVLDAALKAGSYNVRAITRNTSSDKAKALSARGAEVVAADLNNESSLIKAFEVRIPFNSINSTYKNGLISHRVQPQFNP
jgi:nucleoside-diphosphate-sugar epimerase